MYMNSIPSPFWSLKCMLVSSAGLSLAFFIADVALGHPERLLWERKLPLEWPDPSQPGVGQLKARNIHQTSLHVISRVNILWSYISTCLNLYFHTFNERRGHNTNQIVNMFLQFHVPNNRLIYCVILQ